MFETEQRTVHNDMAEANKFDGVLAFDEIHFEIFEIIRKIVAFEHESKWTMSGVTVHAICCNWGIFVVLFQVKRAHENKHSLGLLLSN